MRREELHVRPADRKLRRVHLLRRSDPSREETRRVPRKGKTRTKEDKKQEAIDQLLEVLQSVEQDYDPVWGSALKQAVRRVHPGFNEGYYGYASFSELLKEIADKGLVELEYDESRGNYQIRRKKK